MRLLRVLKSIWNVLGSIGFVIDVFIRTFSIGTLIQIMVALILSFPLLAILMPSSIMAILKPLNTYKLTRERGKFRAIFTSAIQFCLWATLTVIFGVITFILDKIFTGGLMYMALRILVLSVARAVIIAMDQT